MTQKTLIQIGRDSGEIDIYAVEAEARRLRAEACYQFGQAVVRALRRAWNRPTGGVGGKPAHG